MAPVWVILVFIQSLHIIQGYNLRQRGRALEIEGSGIDELEKSDMVADNLELTLHSNAKNTDTIIRDQADLVFNCMILIFLLFLVSNLPMLTDELLAAGGRMSHEVNNMLASKEGRALDVNTLNHMATMVGNAIEIYGLFNK